MWGRFEGKKSLRIALLSAILFLLFPVKGISRELPLWLVMMIEEQCENSDAQAVEQMFDYYAYLLQHKVDVNNCSRETLESLLFLDQFMVEALLEYRSEFGSIASVAELSLVDGFDEESAQRLSPFFDFSQRSLIDKGFSKVEGRWDSRLRYQLAREKGSYLGGALPFSVSGKCRVDVGKRGSMWFTLESDAGEVIFPDFVSMGMSVDDVVLGTNLKIKRLVVGDYSLKMGQGGVMWNSFTISSGAEPSSLLRRVPNTVLPYRSTGESGFYRGGAIVLSFGKFGEATLFYSNRRCDARVEGDYFYSLPSDGLHDSESSILNKGTLPLEHTGFDYGVKLNRLKIGLRGIFYRYGKKDGRKVYEYNKYQRFNGWWSAYSVDFLYSVSGVRFWGEAVVDKRGSLGGILGAAALFERGWEASVLLKYFDRKLIVPTELNNECGGIVSVKCSAIEDLVLAGQFSYNYFPYPRYRVDSSSEKYKGEFSILWKVASNHNISFRIKGADDSGTEKSSLQTMVVYDFVPSSNFSLRGRFDASFATGDYGFLTYLEARKSLFGEKLDISLRATCFNIESWDARIYCYESDVPGTFSTVAYYGKGTSGYILLRYKPKKWVNVNFRCAGVLNNDPSKDILKLTLGVSLLF